MKTEKINVVQIGYGHLGKWHLQKALQSEFTGKVYLVDSSQEALVRAKQEYSELETATDLKEVIDKIDAAVVVSPTSTHFEIVKQLLDSGKHVFCEKPLTESYEQSLEIEKLQSEKKLVVQVGHSERFHKIWEELFKEKELIENRCTIKFDRCGAFKGRATDVDCVQDLMIHDIDLMLYLFKEMPSSVKSTGYKIRTDKWDFVCSDFFFSSGKKCTITASRNHVEEVRKVEITGKLGHIQVDLLNRKYTMARGSEINSEKFVETVEYEGRDHLAIEQDYFYRSIVNGDDVIITVADGVSAMKIIAKVLESLDSGSETTLN